MKACSVVWKNDFYVLGGDQWDPRGIMKLTDKSFNRIADLAFDHTWVRGRYENRFNISSLRTPGLGFL